MTRTLEGKVEITWTNKHRRLVTSADPTVKPPYAWVAPSDYRVAETRLLTEVAHVEDESSGNLLIRGDALHALIALSTTGAGGPNLTGQVRLAYLDPPFNTGKTFDNYEDNLEKSVWLTMMRDRLVQVQKLLRDDGSIWVHCDDSMMAPLRLVMGEVFLEPNFIGTVIWEKADSPRMDAQGFSVRHDYIIVYGASSAVRIRGTSHDSGDQAHYDRKDANGRRYYLKPLRAMGGEGSTRLARHTLWFPMIDPAGNEVWPKLPDGGDGCWRWSQDRVQRDGHLIEWVKGRSGPQPYYRIYGDPEASRPPETIWPAKEVGTNRTSKNELRELFADIAPFDTPKPERLMKRIIELASDPGDIVLDPFAGSGSTAAVAHKLGRRWITVEISRHTTEHFLIPRLTKVAQGKDPGGISATEREDLVGVLPEGVTPADVRTAVRVLEKLTKDGAFAATSPKLSKGERTDATTAMVKAIANEPKALPVLVRWLLSEMRRAGRTRKRVVKEWEGGGGFTVLEVAPSMFDDDNGSIVVADWATGGALAEAIAAQAGVTYDPSGPFCGRKGRARLAVVDGLVNTDVADLLIGHLAERETLMLYGTGLDPAVPGHLASVRPGSVAHLIPQALFASYGRPRRWAPATVPQGDAP